MKKGGSAFYMRAILIFAFGFQLMPSHASPSAAATPTAIRLEQLRHTFFSKRQGAPASAWSMAQAPNGMLWITSDTGITRFDGVNFDSSLSASLPNPAARALFIDPNGVVWVGYLNGGLSKITGDKVKNVDTTGVPPGTVMEIAKTSDGVMWIITTHGVVKRVGDKWITVGQTDGYSGGNPQGAITDKSGSLWITDGKETWHRPTDQARFRSEGSPLAYYRVSAGLPANEPVMQGQEDAGSALLDHSGALWIAQQGSLKRALPDANGHFAHSPFIDQIDTKNGLSDNQVSSLFEDSEGDVWASTRAGLEQFAPTRMTPVVFPDGVERPALVAGADNFVLVGNQGVGYKVSEGLSVLPDIGVISAAGRDSQDAIWLGGTSTLRKYGGKEMEFIPYPEEIGNPGTLAEAIVFDGLGDLWLSVAQRGLFRLHNGEWASLANSPQFPSVEPLSIAYDDGHLWFGYSDDVVIEHASSLWRRYTKSNGLQAGAILAFGSAGHGMWVGGTGGVQFLRDGVVTPLNGVEGQKFIGGSGILQGKNGDLWINGRDGLFHILAADVEKFRSNKFFEVPFDLFDELDGRAGSNILTRPRPTLVESSDGRIWASTQSNVSWIQPETIVPAAMPRAPIILKVEADAKAYPQDEKVRLPPLPKDTQIDYTVAALSTPERVQFRYRLRGYDDKWQLVGSRRQAFFTGLGAGDYIFEVQAANKANVWSGTAARVSFSVAPAYFETIWFRAFVILAALVLLWTLQWGWGRFKTLDMRVRVDERTRIARDLHDTFLQSVQGFILNTHAAMIGSLDPRERQQLLETAIVQAENSLREGREKVSRLRTPTFPSDLADFAFVVAQDLAVQHPTKFSVNTEGEPVSLARPGYEQLEPLVHEALINAFKHSSAKNINVLIHYSRSRLMVRVDDDGCGVEADILRHSKPGHWGLFGMRERAEAMGGHLKFQSAVGKGTSVELRVPSARIYSRRLKTRTPS